MQVTERVEQIRKRCIELIAKIQTIYGVDCSDVKISFNLRGRVAGYAGYKYSIFDRTPSEFYVRFNIDMISNGSFDHIINDTVPHEFAHIVCYKRPELGRNHDQGWKNVCRRLGGNGERCHSQQVVYAKGKTFQYQTTVGKLTTVSEKIHKKIQMGCVYRVKRGGLLNNTCQWVQFGQPFETATPVVPAAPKVTPPAAPAPRAKQAATTGTSKATLVREIIRLAKRDGRTQQYVVMICMTQLEMSKSLATTYVKNNWDKA